MTRRNGKNKTVILTMISEKKTNTNKRLVSVIYIYVFYLLDFFSFISLSLANIDLTVSVASS